MNIYRFMFYLSKANKLKINKIKFKKKFYNLNKKKTS